MKSLSVLALIVALLIQPASGNSAEAGLGDDLQLKPQALAEFERQRLRVPLLRIFDRDQRQVLEVRGWGEGMRALDGLDERERVPGLPSLTQRLAETEAAPTPDPDADYTLLLYYADWCAVCKRMEPELREQIAQAAPVRFQLLRIEADPLRQSR